ncbi:MAG: amidohydrolase family protein, partial [Bdellovibrionales bacterium]|nr:amidohydrolase family protein [Bdellovibrionales bacterium]
LSEKYTDRYALTPRFALTATPNLMKESSTIAKNNNSFIQTHLSETTFEISKTLEHIKSYPGYQDVKSYTEIYERCAHLGAKTILGHGVHLSDEEWNILKSTDTVIAHCPSSNAPISDLGLGSGLFDFSKAEEFGVRWALATDIGGGPFLSMFDVMESFVNQNKGNSNATYIKSLFRSTLAGAQILQIDDITGNLEPGKWANFICINKPKQEFNNTEDLLSSLINNNTSREEYLNLIESTYYQGIKVFSSKR